MILSQVLLGAILIILFSLVFANRLRADIAALTISVLLGLAQVAGIGMLDSAGNPASAVKAISGFGQPVVITLLSLFIITRLMEKSGITRWISRYLIRIGGNSEARLIALFAGVTALLSLFMNNLAAGALVLPSALDASRRTGIKPGKLLIPVAYGSLLGGAATYFTTANIVVSNLLTTASPPQPALNILDFTPTGGLIAAAGIAFMALFGRRLLPDRAPAAHSAAARPTGSELENAYQLIERLWEGQILPESVLIGKNLDRAALGERLGLAVPAVLRGSRLIFPVGPEVTFQPGDRLILIGREERVAPLQQEGVAVRKSETSYLTTLGLTLVEMITAPRSAAVGRSLKDLAFRRKTGFTAVALLREGRSYRTNVADFKLEMGDSLLVVGSPGQVELLRRGPDFIVLEPDTSDQPVEPGRALTSLAIIVGAVAASILGLPVYLSMLAAAVLIILLGLISPQEVYHAVEWQAIFLIAGMYSASLAMVQTGLAALIGDLVLRLVTPFGPLGLAAGAYLLTAALTQVMGGQVTALVTGPVAISAAISMGANPQAVAIATAMGCSVSFLTPMAHPVNMLMIAPANYTPGDFFRMGWPLTIISFFMLMIGLAVFWGM